METRLFKFRGLGLSLVVLAAVLSVSMGAQAGKESLSASGILSTLKATQPKIGQITAAELAGRLGGDNAPVILDVRTEAEFQEGHIPGAINIPHDQLSARMGELPAEQDRELVVHCRSGRRAAAAEEILQKAGFTNVSDLKGHFLGWKVGKYPQE